MHQSPEWVLNALTLREPVWLRREANEFDANAVSVETRNGRRVGYIGRTVAVHLAPCMDTGMNPLQAVVTALTRDISGEIVGMAVGVYLPNELARKIRGEPRWDSYCDVGTDGVTYLFLDCDEAELNQVNDALRRRAMPWRRSGLSYRTAPDGYQYRWYVRLEGDVSPPALRAVLDQTLGPSRSHADSLQMLDEWITHFDEEVRDLRRRAAQGSASVEQIAALEHENRILRDQLTALQARSVELERAARLSTRQRRTLQRREHGETIRLLLPDVQLLQNSLAVITQELESYEPILRELRSLCSNPAEVKGERVEGAPQWRERRFSTGQKHDGRLYFRRDGAKWLALVSFKDCQEQDIEYLKRQ
jgi:hypothetical protein